MARKGQAKEIELVEVSVADLNPHPKNPKRHYDEGIEASIKSKGYIEPIVVDEENTILAGEGRWRALQRLGVVKVKVIRKSGLAERAKLEYLLASNKLVERGGWDRDILKQFDKDILRAGFFETKDIYAIFRGDNLAGDEYDSGGVYASIQEPKTKLGDIYALGSHRLVCGDATNPEYFRVLMEDSECPKCGHRN